MENEEAYLEKIRKSKCAMRRELAALPYVEKIRRIIEMQKFQRDFRKDKSKKIYVWKLGVDEE